MQRNEERALLTELHRTRAERTGHPSPRSLDDYERSLTTRADAADYVDILLRRCSTRHPSPMLLQRLERMVRRIELHDDRSHDREEQAA